MEMTGSPKFLGDPNVPFAHAQATPVSRLNPDRDVRKRRFRFSAWPLQGETQRRSHGKTFEAQSHGFRTRCLRFAVIVTDHHARLASGRWSNPTRRDSRPLGHYQRFLISIHIVIILLRQASWRNPLFLSLVRRIRYVGCHVHCFTAGHDNSCPDSGAGKHFCVGSCFGHWPFDRVLLAINVCSHPSTQRVVVTGTSRV